MDYNEKQRAKFEAWWAKEGQYVRAGGGDYEKCFAYAAWMRQSELDRQQRNHDLTVSFSFDAQPMSDEIRAALDSWENAASGVLVPGDDIETWTDENGAIWVRPTAWAYAQACKALAAAHEKLRGFESQQSGGPVEMGNGNVAVGTCLRSTDGVPGIIYLKLPDGGRGHGADCTDVYPVGSQANDDDVLACIYFKTPEVVQQSIG